ncbi:MAG TPA: FAD-dependent oxidoreductase [Solirubrobacteraceae bacterium]|jgi:3-phenylpropionate/trans-cinnamate dioxygenase ferredoxin reductase subunit
MPTEQVEHLLIGGGLASAKCARTLREEGAKGRVLIVGREPDPPYNRPNCSKGFLRGLEQREESYVDERGFYEEQQIELKLRTSVTKLDLSAKTAKLSNGDEVAFEKALLATGANVRRLNVDGCQLEEIHYLRTLGNSEAIRKSVADAEQIVIVGGSYIGCEVAASLTAMGHKVTVVMQEQVTLERGFGQEAGRFVQDLLESHGVTFHGQDGLDRFEGDSRVRRVITEKGLQLAADTVVIGAGVSPDVQLAKAAGLELGPSGGLACDSQLRTSSPDIFAAGDICEYDSKVHRERLRIEHWDVAFNHGETAAKNMLGGAVDHEVVPYFFSVLADWAELEYVGPTREWDEELLRGSTEEAKFTRWYLKDSRVKAALTVGRGDDLEHAGRLIASHTQLDDSAKAALADPDSDLGSLS